MCFPALLPAVAVGASTAAASTTLGVSAATWGSIGTGLQVAGLATGVMGAYNQSASTKKAFEYQAAVGRNNAQLGEWQARDAITRGQKAEQTQRLKAAALKSTQRASFAARGMALDEGSPLSILQDTDFMGELDASTIKDNAAREAWGYRMQASGASSDAGMLDARAQAESPMGTAGASLLTGAGSVAASWYKRTTKTAGY